MGSSFGHILNITSFGESHGPYVGAVLEGLPADIAIDESYIQAELDRRKPGSSAGGTTRREDDKVQLISGIFEGKSTGAPIAILIPNLSQKPSDYDHLKNIYRPGHADFVYEKKYGIRDYRGGGRSSARITAGWVAAGAIARLWLKQAFNIEVQAAVTSIHHISIDNPFELDWEPAKQDPLRCPVPSVSKAMGELVEQVQREGDSLGGVISARITNCPVGLGEPVFDKLNADLAKAMFAINAVKGIEFGSGFESAKRKGSENNDATIGGTNHDGGITGGISNGKSIEFSVAFKPVSSIAIEQQALNKSNEMESLNIAGRHDSCILPRAVPIVEAMAALAIADHSLLNLKFTKK